MSKDKLNQLQDANLLKKYHSNLLYDYTEYPTKAHWGEDFSHEEYKKSLSSWLKKNSEKPIMFYIHTPFCEQLCWFCLCSKEITQDYSKVEDYLYNYLFKEIELLFNFLNKEGIELNVREIYFGGGSPTYYKNKEFKALIDNLKNRFDFSKIGDISIEIDPRRVDEEKLLFYNSCGVNRLSFGIQEFDLNVQKRINRIQPPELMHKLLSKKIRETYPAFNFDLLIGLPGQTKETVKKTISEVIKLKPTQLQTLLMHYKPGTRKYMINMLRDGPLPDFYDRKIFYSIIEDQLLKNGYEKTGYEMFALKGDPISKAVKEKKALYASLGTQKGEATNFIAIGSSCHVNLGNEYYFQNFYEQNKYRDALNNNQLPIYRGMKLNQDDKIRQELVKTLRTYFEIDFQYFSEKYNINFRDYFKAEIEDLEELKSDKLLTVNENNIKMTELGIHFSPIIANKFDKYNKIKLSNST